jgi:hypothetical protein
MPVLQTNGNTLKLPQNRATSRNNGLTVLVDTRWSQNYGYRPVEVTISSPKPVTQDRKIDLSLFSGWSGAMRVDQEIVLPSGSQSVTATVRVPQYSSDAKIFWWELRVDGFLDKDLSLKKENAYSVMQSAYSVTGGASFLAMTPQSGARTTLSPNSTEFEILSLSAIEFPKRWIEYTCMDAATLSLDELLALQTINPAGFGAMQRWVRAGGNLWVNDVGDNFERLRELSKLFGLQETVSADVQLGVDSPLKVEAEGDLRGWQPVRFGQAAPDGQVVMFQDQRTGRTRTARTPETIKRLESDPNYRMLGERVQPAGETRSLLAIVDSNQWFIDQPLGLGTVRAFRITNDVTKFQQSPPAPNANVAANQDTMDELPPSLSSALDSVGGWSSRHGLSPDSANYGFSDLLVPGMGLAPVTEFQILITLFVVAIGPLNYWLLKRWRRLHLMVLTVPLAAAVVTFALFAYAIITDGFGTTARVYSFTTIDQKSGDAACWSRISYYAGLAPRGGLTMPADVAMYPVVPDWYANSMRAYMESDRDLRWDKGEAKLTRGWLRSRTPTQYLTVRSRKTPIRLEMQPVRDRLRLKNSLGTPIEFVAVVDRNGKFWSLENVPESAVEFMKPIERPAAEAKFRTIVQERSPQPPVELIGTNQNRPNYQQRQQLLGQGYSTTYTGVEELNSNLASVAIAKLAGIDGLEGMALAPGTYVAVTKTGPEVVFGMSGVEEDTSLHVISGQW